MYWPDELPPGRQPYHGTNELIASNHKAAILNKEKTKEATRPLSPTDAEEKETQPTIDVRSGETEDNVLVKEVVRETPLETKNSTPRPTPSRSITAAPAKGSAKQGRKKTGDYKPYAGLFKANLKMQEGPTAWEIRDLRKNVMGGEKS
ncbi:hypothetical protein DER46DRAFT_613622 [Fusarium sp. MPI-SDFR-AT-0072]|nr:hypothetical protein DER46DRAFT_613622 [Fusarium sp. MPI-SDFR-AT-0072]